MDVTHVTAEQDDAKGNLLALLTEGNPYVLIEGTLVEKNGEQGWKIEMGVGNGVTDMETGRILLEMAIEAIDDAVAQESGADPTHN